MRLGQVAWLVYGHRGPPGWRLNAHTASHPPGLPQTVSDIGRGSGTTAGHCKVTLKEKHPTPSQETYAVGPARPDAPPRRPDHRQVSAKAGAALKGQAEGHRAGGTAGGESAVGVGAPGQPPTCQRLQRQETSSRKRNLLPYLVAARPPSEESAPPASRFPAHTHREGLCPAQGLPAAKLGTAPRVSDLPIGAHCGALCPLPLRKVTSHTQSSPAAVSRASALASPTESRLNPTASGSGL